MNEKPPLLALAKWWEYVTQKRLIDIGQDLPIFRTEQYVSRQLAIIKDKLSNYAFEEK